MVESSRAALSVVVGPHVFGTPSLLTAVDQRRYRINSCSVHTTKAAAALPTRAFVHTDNQLCTMALQGMMNDPKLKQQLSGVISMLKSKVVRLITLCRALCVSQMSSMDPSVARTPGRCCRTLCTLYNTTDRHERDAAAFQTGGRNGRSCSDESDGQAAGPGPREVRTYYLLQQSTISCCRVHRNAMFTLFPPRSQHAAGGAIADAVLGQEPGQAKLFQHGPDCAAPKV